MQGLAERSVLCGRGPASAVATARQVNPAPTKRVDLPVVGAGFTPALIGCWSLQIAHFRYDSFWILATQSIEGRGDM
jgi:hypothetical protein